VWRATSPPAVGLNQYSPIGCQTHDNITMLDAAVRGPLRRHHASVVEVASITFGHGDDAVDPFHFDGGVLREIGHRNHNASIREQNVSLCLLGALLEQLERSSMEYALTLEARVLENWEVPSGS